MDYTIPPANGQITLRRFNVDDVPGTYEWVSGSWYTGDFAGSAAVTPEAHDKYFKRVLGDREQVFLAVCEDGHHIGNAGLKYFDSGTCECWYYIGDASRRGKGHASRIVSLLCMVAFSIDSVNCVKARVLTRNIKSSRALLANGFVECGVTVDERGRAFTLYEKSRQARCSDRCAK